MRVHNTEVDHDSVVHQLEPKREQLQRQRAYYLANVTMIDEKVGEILQTLEESNYLENSVVIFTSDHGDCLCDHGHSQKWTMYDTITRVPMLVWSPGRIEGGRRLQGLCQQMDIAPFVLETAGVEVPKYFEAQSLGPALHGKEWSGREVVYAEHGRDGIFQETDFMSMVRTRDWKLVHFMGEDFGQLFDLRNDPGEVRNLWEDAASQPQKSVLLDHLREWRMQSQYHTCDWAAGWR
jgi:arylsulfatase A-like enzyme